MNRRKSREAGFLILFEYSFGHGSVDEIAELAREVRDFEFDDYSVQLARGAADNLPQIDGLIEKNLKDWSIKRISKVSLAILRCAIYEFYISHNVEPEISINEAVELSKKYSLPEETSFVNGVLGSVSRGGNE